MSKNTVLRFTSAALIALGIILIFLYIIGSQEYDFKVDFSQVDLVQLDTIDLKIKDDAKVAVIETDQGTVMAELYTELAPETTANFISLAESGYYDGTYVYEIGKRKDEETNEESRLYFSGGSPYSDGSIDKSRGKKAEKIANEFSEDLWPFKGSFMSCGYSKTTFFFNRRIVYGGSRFTVCGSMNFDDDTKKTMLEDKDAKGVSETFIKYGGIPNASQSFTVFAQTFYGWDTVEKLLSMDADAQNKYQPLDTIMIKKVTICSYADVKDEVESAGPEKKFAFDQTK